MRDADLRGATLTGAKFFFLGWDLKCETDNDHNEIEWFDHIKTDLKNAKLNNADLSGADIRFVNLEGANLSKAIFKGATFTGIQEIYDPNDGCEQTQSVPVNLTRAVLRETSLEELDLTEVVFCGADLSSANLEGTNLSSANLSGAILRETQLKGANLRFVNLEGANLEGADLADAFLVEQPGNARLREVNFQRANFQGAILIRAYLSAAKNLTLEQLTGENPPYLCKVRLPSDIQVDGNRDCEKLPQVLKDRYPERFKTLEEAKAYVDEL